MKSKKVFLVISEKHERITMRRKTKKVIRTAYCKNCQTQVGWLKFEEVSMLTEKKSEEVRKDFDNGKFDYQIAPDGQILICLNSIFK
jgi:hypothetical protein